MANPLRSIVHRYVPQHFHDPIGLAARLLRTRDRAALFSMWSAALGIAMTPLDAILQISEKRIYRKAGNPSKPIIFVCGPPRSGTTLAEQILITGLRVAFMNNLTAIFPRSPILANWLFGGFTIRPDGIYQSYYGKSAKLGGPNDALYLWDRWLGVHHRSSPAISLPDVKRSEMCRFFGAFQEFSGLPTVNKNNNLNTCAHLVAEAIPLAHFICIVRDRRYLAQSLLLARQEIHGDLSVPYGIGSPIYENCFDPIEDVCRQVMYHERVGRWQQTQIGVDRFWLVRYEDVCAAPNKLLKRVSQRILGDAGESRGKSPKPFRPSRLIKVEPEVFDRICTILKRLDGDEASYWTPPA